MSTTVYEVIGGTYTTSTSRHGTTSSTLIDHFIPSESVKT
jgi:hypothetical protein